MKIYYKKYLFCAFFVNRCSCWMFSKDSWNIGNFFFLCIELKVWKFPFLNIANLHDSHDHRNLPNLHDDRYEHSCLNVHSQHIHTLMWLRESLSMEYTEIIQAQDIIINIIQIELVFIDNIYFMFKYSLNISFFSHFLLLHCNIIQTFYYT